MQISNVLEKELIGLPEKKVNEVIDFIRFLKIQQEPDKSLEKRFVNALEKARNIWKNKKITAAEITAEINKVRKSR